MSKSTGGGRIDWRAERDRIDLAAVATGLLGPAPGRAGEHGRRLWWHCPFHSDDNPSFMIEPGKPFWKCYGCGESGDAATLVMKREGLTFPEAVARLTGRLASSGAARPHMAHQTRREAKPAVAPGGPRGMSEAAALALVIKAEARLWSPDGVQALAYLTGPRCLTPATIRAARLGWTPRAKGVPWSPPGLVIPWSELDRFTTVKFRPPDEWRESFPKHKRPPKYLEGFRDGPSLYPGRQVIRPGRPLVIVEGELDCLLLGQELVDLAAVVTLGGAASTKPEPAILGSMLAASPWFVATDGDEAGDKAAARWGSTRAMRVRPPGAFKDWTESRQAGVDLRRWWSDRLGGDESPPIFTWDELESWRWGPAILEADPDPGERGPA